MNFTALKAELAARVPTAISDTRQGQYINQARGYLDDLEFWSYREASVTGSPPLSVSDLGVIEMVVNTTTDLPLQPVEWRNLVDAYGDTSTTGTPQFYYVAQPAGVTPMVATYPVGGTIGIQYWRTTPDLSAGSDTPLSPTRFHMLIVDMAMARIWREIGKLAEQRDLLESINQDLENMRAALLTQQTQGPQSYQLITGASEDW